MISLKITLYRDFKKYKLAKITDSCHFDNESALSFMTYQYIQYNNNRKMQIYRWTFVFSII